MKRLNFARRYLHWTVEDWSKVVWSDETKINRFGSDGDRWVWKSGSNPDGVLSDREITPTYKFGGGSLMMWGCITWDWIGGYCRILDRMDADLYCEILRGELMATLEDQDREVGDVVFQQDNDPKHTSQKAQACLEELGLEVLEWPPQFPDLNPIEQAWTYLERRLGKYPTPPAGIEELWRRVQEEWQQIPVEFIRALIESMPQRVRAILRAKGAYTKY